MHSAPIPTHPPDYIVLDVENAVNQIHHVLALQDYSLLEDDLHCLIEIMIFSPLHEAYPGWCILMDNLGIFLDDNIDQGFREAYIEIQTEAAKSFDPIKNYTLEKVTDTHALLRKHEPS